MLIKNRIVGSGEKAAEEFNANPLNWRVHSKAQQTALNSILVEVGWVQNTIINVRTGNTIDGHLRVDEAFQRNPKELVPFIEVNLSLEEEQKILAVMDPIGAMASTMLKTSKVF
jgi:hypothetical protein